MIPKSDRPLPSQTKWNRDLNLNVEWERMYSRCCKTTSNTTLVWFQDKIIHRILTNNSFVSKFMDVSSLCTFCQRERESILHLLVQCNEVDLLWMWVKNRIRDRLHVQVQLDSREIILGLDPEQYDLLDVNLIAIQRLLLLVKWYIYRSKVRNEHVNAAALSTFLKISTDAELLYVRHASNESCKRKREASALLCYDADA